MNQEKTICAFSTSVSPQSVGIIRISGDDALQIISKVFFTRNKKTIPLNESHKVYYGFIFDEDTMVDEVLVITMLKPKSYTKEDVVEIHSHGSPYAMQWIFSTLIKNGAFPAESGEFTKRAFLNGRIDLSEAEAVMDIINSKNKYANISALNQLTGSINEKILQIRKTILSEMAFIEACLDDPEHMSFEERRSLFLENINSCIEEIDLLLKNSKEGKLIKEGINTVIIGKPNSGKSSLLNFLLKEERAIVSNIEGTTRDVIRENINIEGISLNIIDTAGLRENKNADEIEIIGMKKTKEEIKSADLVLLLFDSTIPFDENFNKNIFSLIEKDKPTIIILNKQDLLKNNDISSLYKKFFISSPIILFSTKTGFGEKELKETIKNLFFNNKINFNTEIFISNERQIKNLEDAKTALKKVLFSFNENLPEDFFTVDLKNAYSFLSHIIGEEVNDDLINEIFKNFCIGK